METLAQPEMMEVMIKTISCKNEKMIKIVMVAPIEAMRNRHLLMRRYATIEKNNNNSVSHYTRREKLTQQLTQTH